MRRFTCIFSGLMAVGMLCAASAVQAAAWPERMITIINPFSAGGLSDTAARRLAQTMQDEFKQSVVVENRPGAGGIIGTEYAARKAADGYTLLVTGAHHIVNQAIRTKMSYDAANDFTPVAMLVTAPVILAVPSDSPVNSVQEFIDMAKSKPGGASIGTAGVGGMSHMGSALFAQKTGIPVTDIPYQGGAPLLTGLAGGQIDGTFLDPASLTPLYDSKRVKLLAVADSKRVEGLPDIPTMAEVGFPGIEATTWMALFVPAGTPNDIVAKLNDIAMKSMNGEAQKAWLESSRAKAGTMNVQEFKAFTISELEKWSLVAKEANIQVD